MHYIAVTFKQMVYFVMVCVIFYHLGLGHPPRGMRSDTHTDGHTDNATFRMNRPRGQFTGNSVYGRLTNISQKGQGNPRKKQENQKIN